MSVIERCARALYAQAGKEWLKSYPWESDDRIAVEARERAMEQAKVALEAVNCVGAVEAISRLADMTDGLPYEETDTPEQLIERAIRLAHQFHGEQ
jgi:hypothetical protein